MVTTSFGIQMCNFSLLGRQAAMVSFLGICTLISILDKANSDTLRISIYDQEGFINAAGQRIYPATALVCNFSKPTPTKPSLLKHDEVVVLFHELGHGIHDLVGKTKFARYHGTMCVQDFCEVPSQLVTRELVLVAWTAESTQSALLYAVGGVFPGMEI
ncbi:metallopeptidase protein [Rutstroemia sp. NJR-2017a BBW]|nr:metallopeptidase protein [Rutstroemia sp. NJR-2017a BBW]